MFNQQGLLSIHIRIYFSYKLCVVAKLRFLFSKQNLIKHCLKNVYLSNDSNLNKTIQ